MERRIKRIVAGIIVAILVVLCVTVVLVLPSDEDLRKQAVAEVDRRFGIKVTIASVHWQLLPTPSVTVRRAETDQKQPIEILRLSAYPNLRRVLLDRRFTVERLELDGAVIPTASLAAFRRKQKRAVVNPHVAPVEHVRFRNVTWISRIGIPVPIEGEVDFDPLWRPHYAQVRRSDFTPVARITLDREGGSDRWTTRVALGAGTADGIVALTTRKNGTLVLDGTLKPRGIEVASAAESLNRRSPIGGRANGHTVVSARGTTAGELGQTLRLLTDFRISPATVLRFDLDKAIRTAGKEHDGKTTLESLTGVLDMQNTAEGTVLHFSDLEAHAGSFTATGEATVFNRKVEAQGTLDLVQGVVGIPFTITGSIRKPKVAVPPGVLVGAVAGTAVLPGVGTVIGARLGGAAGHQSDPRPGPPGTPDTEPTPAKQD
jgi:hypothetical protein